MPRVAVCRVCGVPHEVTPLRPVVDRVGKATGLVYRMVGHRHVACVVVAGALERREVACDGSDDYVAAHLVVDSAR